MRDQPSAPGHGVWSWPAVGIVMSLVGAVTLCVIGVFAMTENYDGVTSWLNPVGAAGTCGALGLVMTAALAWSLRYEAKRDRARGDGH